jgi:hypothetical protein
VGERFGLHPVAVLFCPNGFWKVIWIYRYTAHVPDVSNISGLLYVFSNRNISIANGIRADWFPYSHDLSQFTLDILSFARTPVLITLCLLHPVYDTGPISILTILTKHPETITGTGKVPFLPNLI